MNLDRQEMDQGIKNRNSMSCEKGQGLDLVTDILNSFKKYSENNAFFIEGATYTYQQLSTYVDHIYASIEGKENKVIGIIAENKIETYASILAVLASGNTYVILHPDYPESRNQRIAGLAGIDLLLGSQAFQHKPLPLPQIRFLCTSEKREEAFETPLPKGKEDDNAYIIFTSGSTGEPKGVPISRKNLNAFYAAYTNLGWQLDETDRMLQMFELTFDVSVVSFLYPLTLGACVYTVGPDDVKYLKVFELLEDYGLTFAAVAPSLLQFMSSYFNEIHLPQLKYLVVTAEAANADLISRFRSCIPNAQIVNLYGPTEGTIYCTSYPIPLQACKQHNGMVAIGKPFKGIDCLITDDQGHPVPTGETGELWICGNQIMKGYWKNPEKSDQAIVRTEGGNVYYKTGDLCQMDAEGDIIYCGRKDFQIKIQGFRIELSEIEYVARKFYKNEHNVVVVPIYRDDNYCELHLVIECEAGDKQDLEAYLKSQLPTYMLPKHIHYLEHFPLSTSNKIDRKKIVELI